VDLEAREYKIVAGQFLLSDPDAYEIVLVKDYATRITSAWDAIWTFSRRRDHASPRGGPDVKGRPGQLNNGALVPCRSGRLNECLVEPAVSIRLILWLCRKSPAAWAWMTSRPPYRPGWETSTRSFIRRPGAACDQMLDGYQMGLNMLAPLHSLWARF